MQAHHAISLLLVGACAVPEDLSTLEQGVACTPAVCGFNSPDIDFDGFHELRKDGGYNDEGLAITGFEKNGYWYRLDVSHNELSGQAHGLPTIAHADLVGAEIRITRRRDNAEFAIRVANVGSVPYFTEPAGNVETYELVYGQRIDGDIPTSWTNLCDGRWNPDGETGTPDVPPVPEETLGMLPIHSVLFDLDRVDFATKTMNDRPDPGWFNIGCAGHTLSKLHLTHNTIASQSPAWNERQATLKLLVADYCHDGTAFTVAGQKLSWAGGGMSFFGTPIALESYWNENGAMCLGMPRMARPTTTAGMLAFPDIETQIAKHCSRPPPCPNRHLPPRGALRTSAVR